MCVQLKKESLLRILATLSEQVCWNNFEIRVFIIFSINGIHVQFWKEQSWYRRRYNFDFLFTCLCYFSQLAACVCKPKHIPRRERQWFFHNLYDGIISTFVFIVKEIWTCLGCKQTDKISVCSDIRVIWKPFLSDLSGVNIMVYV